MTTRHLMFNNDVVVEVFPVDNNLYDFSIYTDINREKVESDDGAYEDILFRLKILPLGFYTRSEIGQVLREVREVTNDAMLDSGYPLMDMSPKDFQEYLVECGYEETD